jgi:hypothetical protein
VTGIKAAKVTEVTTNGEAMANSENAKFKSKTAKWQIKIQKDVKHAVGTIFNFDF